MTDIYSPIIITQKIIDEFEPTRLAIKELAGKKYFCKSGREDIVKYTGSGVNWLKRVKKYGKQNINTLWVSDWYYCPHEIQEAALQFSKENQIVESESWANMKPENGIDGNTSGYAKAFFGTPEMRKQQSDRSSGTNNPKYDPTQHSFIHESGKIFEGTMLEFKRNNPHISNGKVSNLVSGKRKSIYGWRLLSTDKTDVGQSSVKKKLTDNTIYTFVHTDGIIVKCTRAEFRSSICDMARGCVNEIVNSGKTRKGWSLKK
jgi:hypothetical protein